MKLNIGISISVNYCFSETIDPIYDGVSTMYTLRRPAMSTLWTNAVFKLRRDSDNATAYVFFDGSGVNDTITLDSLISTSSNTTPGATTLDEWIGTADGAVNEWIGITDDNTIDTNKILSQATTTLQPLLVDNGGVLLKEGTPYVNFSSATQYLSSTANGDLAAGNDFTIFTNSFSFNNVTVQGFLSTADTAADRFEMFNDRTANTRMGIIRNTGATNYIVNLLSQADNNNQRIQSIEKNGGNLLGYLADTLQETVAWTGTYTNDILVLGAGQNKSNPLQGGVQDVIIFPSILT